MSFTVDSIREYEALFQSMTVGNNTKVLPLSKLQSLMQLCGTSPTRQQLDKYERMVGRDVFSFGDFLDVLAKQMDTEMERQMNHLLYRFFAHCELNENKKMKEEDSNYNGGQVNTLSLIQLLCHSGPEPIPVHLLQNLLDKNDCSQVISIDQFMKWFGKKEEEEEEVQLYT